MRIVGYIPVAEVYVNRQALNFFGFQDVDCVINPRRACAAKVTVVVCLCVCVCVVSVTLNLTCRMFVRLTNDTTYLTGNEGQKFRTVFSENAPLQS